MRSELRYERAVAAIDLLGALRCTRHRHDLLVRRAWDLRDDLTIYDAAYVALAERLAVPMITLDARLARTAERHVAVELVA
jgi:predicted nucleic acid-binding protein